MSDGGSVLPQAEIDALFKQATGKSISPPPASGASASGEASHPSASPAAPSAKPPQKAEPAVPSSPVQTASPAPSDNLLKTIQTTLDDLAQRMTKVETNISMLSQKEERATDVSLPIQKLSQRLETVAKNLRKVDSQVGGILRGLEGTPDYSIRNDFTCQSCGSHDFIAIPMRCTKCGSDGWWGWWPNEK